VRFNSVYRLFTAAPITLVAFASCTSAATAEILVKSPDKSITVTVDTTGNGQLIQSVRVKDQAVLEPSAVGIQVDDQDLGQKATLGKPATRSVRETYPVSGVHRTGLDQYQEAVIPITEGSAANKWKLEVRVFNDGYAYRYRVPGAGIRKVVGESSEWKLPAGSTLWYQSGKNVAYEAPFVQKKVEEVEAGTTIMAAATAKLPGNLGYAMMTEANLVNYSDMVLTTTAPGTFKAFFPEDQKGWVMQGEIVSPWRVTILTQNLNQLVNTDIIHNLCPPAPRDLANAKWIQPGRSTWHWLVTGPPKLEQQPQWVNWTQQLGFEYYLIDDGWKRWKTSRKDAWECLKLMVDYASARNVKVFAWVNSAEVFKEEDRLAYFKKAKEIGLVGLKIDFPHAPNIEWVNWYDNTLRDAAKYQLMIDFHGALKPSGRERTWPNELTREAVFGRESGKLPSLHDAALPFTRYVQGPADFTPAEFRANRVNHSSWGHELAQAIVYTSPFLCYGGRPEDFLVNPALSVIKTIPPTWDETVVLPGSEIGSVAAFARRKGNDWFIGIVNGTEGRTLPLDLSFLGKGSYHIEQFADNPDRPDAWNQSQSDVTNKDHISIVLRPDGGYVAHITKK
jgi:alpha-glucosidase